MPTTKVTITLKDEQLAAIQEHVRRKKSKSVSAFIQHAVEVSLSDLAEFRKMLDESLERSGGPLTAAERRWLDGVVRSKKRIQYLRGPGKGST